MVCAYCDGETEVFNSRTQKRNNQIWRRRRCLDCSALFTTHEAIYLPAVYSVKSNNSSSPFVPDKLFSEILITLRHRQSAYEDAREVCSSIMRKVFKNASEGLILPQEISREAASTLKKVDKQAWLRYLAEHPSLYGLNKRL